MAEWMYRKLGGTSIDDVPFDSGFNPRYLPEGRIAADVQHQVNRRVGQHNRGLRDAAIGTLGNALQTQQVYSRGGAAAMMSGAYGQLANTYLNSQMDAPDVTYYGQQDAIRRANRKRRNAGYISAAANIIGSAVSAIPGIGPIAGAAIKGIGQGVAAGQAGTGQIAQQATTKAGGVQTHDPVQPGHTQGPPAPASAMAGPAAQANHLGSVPGGVGPTQPPIGPQPAPNTSGAPGGSTGQPQASGGGGGSWGGMMSGASGGGVAGGGGEMPSSPGPVGPIVDTLGRAMAGSFSSWGDLTGMVPEMSELAMAGTLMEIAPELYDDTEDLEWFAALDQIGVEMMGPAQASPWNQPMRPGSGYGTESPMTGAPWDEADIQPSRSRWTRKPGDGDLPRAYNDMKQYLGS